jgi:hypothetical protein
MARPLWRDWAHRMMCGQGIDVDDGGRVILTTDASCRFTNEARWYNDWVLCFRFTCMSSWLWLLDGKKEVLTLGFYRARPVPRETRLSLPEDKMRWEAIWWVDLFDRRRESFRRGSVGGCDGRQDLRSPLLLAQMLLPHISMDEQEPEQ